MTTSSSPPRRSKAALFSAALPGLGQAYTGRSKLAYGMFVVDFILVSAVVAGLWWFQLEVAKMWVNPDALLVIMGVNLAILIYRGYAVIGAYRAAPRSGRVGWWGGVGLAVAALLLVVPHVAFGHFAWTSYDLITSVFVPPTPIAADTTSTTTSSTTPSSVPVAPGSTTTTLPPTTTTTTVPVFWDGLERLNIVLLGSDAGPGRRGTRTDTTIVVSIDPATGEVAMFSLPRNLSNAPLPPGMGTWDCNCFPDLLAHLFDAAERNPDAFPGPNDPWFNAIKGATGEILGIPIHYYAMVTLNGFVGVVDALGGVTIDVPKRIVDDQYPHENGTTVRVVIEEGLQHLDGHRALAYARSRRASDDFARMHRQRCVLGAVVDQTSPLQFLLNFPSLAAAIRDNVYTDIPQDRLGDLVDLVPKISTDRITSLRFDRSYMVTSPPGRALYNMVRIKREAQMVLDDPVAARHELGLNALDTTCEE